ncbi:MAG: hypothetical protein WDZ59_12235 [Pirellulales bacterium]
MSSTSGHARWLPPVCMLLALVSLLAGFALLAFGQPEASVEQIGARASGDEIADVMEQQLDRRQLSRRVLIGCLFTAAILLTWAAFSSMRSGTGKPPG